MSQKFKIGIFASSPSWQAGVEYIQNLVLALSSLPQEISEKVSISLLSANEEVAKNYSHLNGAIDKNITFEYLKHNPGKLERVLNKIIQSSKTNLTINFKDHSANFDFLYPVIYTDFSGTKYPCPWGAWIPDFQHKYFPQNFSEKELKIREIKTDQVLRLANKIIVSSQVARDDAKIFYPNYVKNVEVLNFYSTFNIYGKNLTNQNIQKKYNLPEKYFITCNQFWKHKNHSIIFKAIELLKKNGVNIHFIFTGSPFNRKDPDFFNHLLQEIHFKNIDSNVHILGIIPREDQLNLINHSLAVVQPSYFEGWSTVVEDCRELGKQIILSKIPVHLEQNPISGNFFDPDSKEDLASILKLYWNSDYKESFDSKDQQKINRQNFAKQFLKIAGFNF